MTELYDESRDDPKGYAMSDEGINGQMSAVEMLLAENRQDNLDAEEFERTVLNATPKEGKSWVSLIQGSDETEEDLPW